MKNLDDPGAADRGAADNRETIARPPAAPGGSGRDLWSMIAEPMRRSIRARIGIALSVALIGLGLMAGIALLSGQLLLDSLHRAVAMASGDMVLCYDLQVSLRQAERLASSYVIKRDAGAAARFGRLAEEVDRRFQQLNYLEARRTRRRFGIAGALARGQGEAPAIADGYAAWLKSREVARSAFRFAPGTADAAREMSRLVASLERAHNEVSDFHQSVMSEMRQQVVASDDFARRFYFLTITAAVVGCVFLTAAAILIGRSILQPIGRLRVAAGWLEKGDLSHRVKLANMEDELGELGKAFNAAAAALQSTYQELERCSTHDGLTGSLNRAAFEERLAAECKSADRHHRPLSLLMVDVDFFKRVNDEHGHQTGDRVLQEVVRLLTKASRPGDVVARYGGEEFAIILPETGAVSAAAIADRLRDTVERHRFDRALPVKSGVTVSIGCASRRPRALTPREFVKAADEALYRAKETGRNRVVLAREPSPTGRQRARATSAA